MDHNDPHPTRGQHVQHPPQLPHVDVARRRLRTRFLQCRGVSVLKRTHARAVSQMLRGAATDGIYVGVQRRNETLENRGSLN